MSDALILYSWRLVDEWELGGYREKIRILAEHSIDTCEFSPVKKLNERDLVLGYVGRLSTEKGILNFLDSIPLILREHPRARVLIIGDGPLRDKVSEYLAVNRLVENVKMIGWVPHEDLPRYFNELKLLVLPSYTEGFPFVLLEAMACGVPVLATPVGAVPDVIEDRVTGFLMENNSGECIAKNVNRAFSDPGLEEMVKKARSHVEMDYTYDATVKKFKEVLYELNS